MKPRLLFVGRRRYRQPRRSDQRKFDAMPTSPTCACSRARPRSARDARRDVHARPAAPGPRLLDGLAFHALLPFASRASSGGFDPTPCSSRARTRRRSRCSAGAARAARAEVVLDVHGDWRTATRLYGSPTRRGAEPARRSRRRVVGSGAWTRSGRSRTSRPARAGARRRAHGDLPAFMDLDPFLTPPGPAAGAARRALRRRARALQGARPARRGVAARGGARARRGAPADRRRARARTSRACSSSAGRA